jgi:hypothetical protein
MNLHSCWSFECEFKIRFQIWICEFKTRNRKHKKKKKQNTASRATSLPLGPTLTWSAHL